MSEAQVVANTGNESEPTDPNDPADKTLVVLEQILKIMERSTMFSLDQPADKTSESDILKQILETMQKSNAFQPVPQDVTGKYWANYHQIADEHDNELIERHATNLDGLLIFAGLFSAVSSAFIIATQPASDSGSTSIAFTNDLLRLLLIHTMNDTAALDVLSAAASTTSPTSSTPSGSTWIQSLAYTGLFASLLAAFGAVLAKQWLAHFKSSRWGRGSLEERCKRRQAKLDGMRKWAFDAVLDALPILLHFSFLLFGVALGANVWLQDRSVAAVIFAVTALAGGFYVCTFFASFASADCPYQTPLAAVLPPILDLLHCVGMMTLQRLTWVKTAYRQTKTFGTYMLQVFKSVSVLKKIFSHRQETLAHPYEMDERYRGIVSVSASDLGQNGLAVFELGLSDAAVDPSTPSTICWILETSTDPNTITNAALMIPKIEWSLHCNVHAASLQLRNMIPQKAYQFDFNLPEDNKVRIWARAIIWMECIGGSLDVSNDIWHIGFSDCYSFNSMPDYLPTHWTQSMIEAASILSFLLNQPDINASGHFTNITIDVISKLLIVPKLNEIVLVDCLLCMNLLLGRQIVPGDLFKKDKSQAKEDLVNSVISFFQEALSNLEWNVDFYEDLPDSTCRLLQLLVPLSYFPSHNILEPNKAIQLLSWMLRMGFYSLKLQDTLMYGTGGYIALQNWLSSWYPGECDGSQVCPWINYSKLNLTRGEAHFIIDFLDRLLHNYPLDALDKQLDTSKFNYDQAACAMTAAFLLLSSCGPILVGNFRKFTYFNVIMHSMKADKPVHVRLWAFKAACYAVNDLLLVDDYDFLSEFSDVLYGVSCIDYHHSAWATIDFYIPSKGRDHHYIRLLTSLVNEPSWCKTLSLKGHLQRCLSIAQDIQDINYPRVMLSNEDKYVNLIYISGILMSAAIGTRIDVSSSQSMAEINISTRECYDLVKATWDMVASDYAQCDVYWSNNEPLWLLIQQSMQYCWPCNMDLSALKENIRATLDAFRGTDFASDTFSSYDLYPPPAQDHNGVETITKELEKLVAFLESESAVTMGSTADAVTTIRTYNLKQQGRVGDNYNHGKILCQRYEDFVRRSQ